MRKRLLVILHLALVSGLCTTPLFGQEARNLSPFEKEAAAWYYAGATRIGASTSIDKLHKTLLTTADDVSKVENFYRKTSHHPFADKLVDDSEKRPFGIHSSFGYPHPKDKDKQILAVWADDSKTRTDGDDRGVTIRSLAYDTPDEFVSVVMSRTTSDKTTHILLVYLKKK